MASLNGFARVFLAVGPVMDRRGAATHRGQLVERACGHVLEIGAGYGATFGYYPPTVVDVIALEPNPALRRQAITIASRARIPIHVVDGVAESIDCADSSVDTVVSSLVLCSVPDPDGVLAELSRILRPGGMLLFYEHVRSANRAFAAAEDLLTPAWSALAGGCHPNRNTLASITAAGFVVDTVRRFGHSILSGTPRVAHILGAAYRP